jgi:hypothetical protein
MTSPKRPRRPRPPHDDAAPPRYRSSAVARMVRIPVATLRIWESRYRVSAAALSDAGHRLYSAADVQRLALLKQLTDVGHAIGTLAALDMAQLRHVASTHAGALAGAPAGRSPSRPWRVAVVGGEPWTDRLQRPAVLRRLDRPLVVGAAFATLDDVAATLDVPTVDALLLHAPILREGDVGALHLAAASLGTRRVGVLHGYATTAACEAFDRAGVSMLREPQDDRSLAAWLQSLARTRAAEAVATRQMPTDLAWPAPAVAPRRYDDATLADFAGLSSTIACECPRHVADLVAQLSAFESYSAECASRGPRDAALHRYLEQVAGTARALFESALERVAIEEGLVLRPATSAAGRARRASAAGRPRIARAT